MSARACAGLAAALWLGACATVPVETRPSGDLDWDAHADVDVIEIFTIDPDGDVRQTKVWFARVDGQTYLRTSGSRWLRNIRSDPRVTVRVADVDYPQLAEIVQIPEVTEAVQRALADKHGFSDRAISLVRARNPDILRLRPR
jgi:hypothetical protein